LFIILLAPFQSLNAAVDVTSGTVHLGNTLTYGTTAYSIAYSYPTTAQVGKNLTIAVTLHVDSLSGAIEYISGYAIIAYVYVGAQLVGNSSAVSGRDAPFLYPGGTWGPRSVDIPLTSSNTGLSKGQSANATVSLILQNLDYVVNGRHLFYTNEPPVQAQAGSLLIQGEALSTTASTASQGGGQAYLPDALLASGAVLMLLAVALWPRSPRGKPGVMKGVRAQATNGFQMVLEPMEKFYPGSSTTLNGPR
jgi:hypothetical protein